MEIPAACKSYESQPVSIARFSGCKTNYKVYHVETGPSPVPATSPTPSLARVISSLLLSPSFHPEVAIGSRGPVDQPVFHTIQPSDRTSRRILRLQPPSLVHVVVVVLVVVGGGGADSRAFVRLILLVDDLRACYRRIYTVNYHRRARQMAVTVFQ